MHIIVAVAPLTQQRTDLAQISACGAEVEARGLRAWDPSPSHPSLQSTQRRRLLI